MNGCLLALVLSTSLVSHSQNAAPTKSSDQQQLHAAGLCFFRPFGPGCADLFTGCKGDDQVSQEGNILTAEGGCATNST